VTVTGFHRRKFQINGKHLSGVAKISQTGVKMGDKMGALRTKQNITAFVKRAIDTLRTGEIRRVRSIILGRAATTFIVALKSKAEKDATAILYMISLLHDWQASNLYQHTRWEDKEQTTLETQQILKLTKT